MFHLSQVVLTYQKLSTFTRGVDLKRMCQLSQVEYFEPRNGYGPESATFLSLVSVFNPETPHLLPYTLHPSPYTQHPTPNTLHPQPSRSLSTC